MPKNSVPSSTPIHTSVVAAFFDSGPPERGDAVRDRLDAGERDRARREALQQQEERERAADLAGASRRGSGSNGTGLMSPKNDRDRP